VNTMLEVDHLSVALDCKEVLNDLSFSVHHGNILVIIGPNGAGKTTLLRALNGLVPIRNGKVHLNGEDLITKDILERAKLIASVPQAGNLPAAFRVRDVVILGRTPYLNWLGQTSKSDEEIVQEALSQTQTEKLADRMVSELSAGEQQRVLLARALAQTTPILFMDEPTTHLDLKYQVELLNLIKDLTRRKKLITLLVLHDLNLSGRFADQVMILHQGQIAAWGDPSQVLTRDLLSRVYRVPIQVEKKYSSLHIFPE